MYHQYMFGSFSPVTPPSKPSGNSCAPKKPKAHRDPLGNLTGSLSGLLGNLRKQDLLSRFDTGDILLILIILFLFIEGDNLELVITLGLMLLLGLDDTQSSV